MNKLILHIRRFGVRLTADRRRFAALCLLSAVALLFWTRLIVIKRIPKTALADPVAVQIERATEAAAPAAAPVTVLLPERPARDPFGINGEAFPLPEAAEDTRAQQGGPRDRAAHVGAAVAGMTLEAAMPPALAVIDGATRRRGDQVATTDGFNFEVVEIRPRSVVLARSGARFVLRME